MGCRLRMKKDRFVKGGVWRSRQWNWIAQAGADESIGGLARARHGQVRQAKQRDGHMAYFTWTQGDFHEAREAQTGIR